MTLKIHLISLLKTFRKIFSKGFLYLLSANIIVQIAGFGGQIFLTRILAVDDIGRIKILQSYLLIFSIIGTVGVNTAILKLCSEDINKEKKQKIFINGVKISLIGSLLVIFAALALSLFEMISSDALTNNIMNIFILQLPFIVFSSVTISYLQAINKIEDMSKVQVYSKLTIIVISTMAAFILAFKGYVIALVIGNALVIIFIFPLIKPEIKRIFEIKLERGIVKKIIKIGKYALISNLLGQLLITLNILIANYLVEDKASIGYYSIAQLILVTLMMVPSTLNQLMTPVISRSSMDICEVKKILYSYRKKMLLLSLVLFLGSYFLIPTLIPLIFGIEYKASVPYLKILLVGLFFWSLYSPKGITLMSVGKINYNFYTNLIAFIFSVVSNVFLIMKFGMLGGAIATSLTYFVTVFINNYYFKKYLNTM